jgi:hypothetical protein
VDEELRTAQRDFERIDYEMQCITVKYYLQLLRIDTYHVDNIPVYFFHFAFFVLFLSKGRGYGEQSP